MNQSGGLGFGLFYVVLIRGEVGREMTIIELAEELAEGIFDFVWGG